MDTFAYPKQKQTFVDEMQVPHIHRHFVEITHHKVYKLGIFSSTLEGDSLDINIQISLTPSDMINEM